MKFLLKIILMSVFAATASACSHHSKKDSDDKKRSVSSESAYKKHKQYLNKIDKIR